VAYEDLIRVLGEEARREAAAISAAAAAEAERIRAEARAAAADAREALLARARGEADAASRVALEAAGLERDRALLAARRAHLDALRAEVAARLAGAGGPRVRERLLREVLASAGGGSFDLVVDPGEEGAWRALLARVDPAALARALVRGAPAARGGVALEQGRLVLDDTLPARLERAWPDLEPRLAEVLFAGGAEEGASTGAAPDARGGAGARAWRGEEVAWPASTR
jgi:V/A-type H+-transporting ATPase subunit E